MHDWLDEYGHLRWMQSLMRHAQASVFRKTRASPRKHLVEQERLALYAPSPHHRPPEVVNFLLVPLEHLWVLPVHRACVRTANLHVNMHDRRARVNTHGRKHTDGRKHTRGRWHGPTHQPCRHGSSKSSGKSTGGSRAGEYPRTVIHCSTRRSWYGYTTCMHIEITDV